MDHLTKSSKYCLAIVFGLIIGAVVTNMLNDKKEEDCGCKKQ
tara:strand:- start:210 stop:335 length:126 start_codon:yes stop_codon:yes gene_type:complete